MSNENNRTGRETCYICGSANSDVLETHHIVPRRHGGDDSAENLVDLCPSCHATLEKLYNKRFYDELGVEKNEKQTPDVDCLYKGCYAEAEHTFCRDEIEVYTCDAHRECDLRSCQKRSVAPILSYNDDGEKSGVSLRCDEHLVCFQNDCESTNTVSSGFGYGNAAITRCWGHVQEMGGFGR